MRKSGVVQKSIDVGNMCCRRLSLCLCGHLAFDWHPFSVPFGWPQNRCATVANCPKRTVPESFGDTSAPTCNIKLYILEESARRPEQKMVCKYVCFAAILKQNHSLIPDFRIFTHLHSPFVSEQGSLRQTLSRQGNSCYSSPPELPPIEPPPSASPLRMSLSS